MQAWRCGTQPARVSRTLRPVAARRSLPGLMLMTVVESLVLLLCSRALQHTNRRWCTCGVAGTGQQRQQAGAPACETASGSPAGTPRASVHTAVARAAAAARGAAMRALRPSGPLTARSWMRKLSSTASSSVLASSALSSHRSPSARRRAAVRARAAGVRRARSGLAALHALASAAA